MTTTYRERPAGLAVVLRSPRGPVWQEIDRVGVDLYRSARLVTSQRVNRLTGQYERGFETPRTTAGPAGPRTALRNTSDHALILEDGSRPHIIRPRRAGGVLRFRGFGGQVVYARVVHHPGTQSYRIMADALRRTMRRYGA